MFFIFGMGHETVKSYESAVPKYCWQCSHEGKFTITAVKKWVSLFFVPVFPYSAAYFLTCPCCGERTYISKEEFKQYLAGAGISRL